MREIESERGRHVIVTINLRRFRKIVAVVTNVLADPAPMRPTWKIGFIISSPFLILIVTDLLKLLWRKTWRVAYQNWIVSWLFHNWWYWKCKGNDRHSSYATLESRTTDDVCLNWHQGSKSNRIVGHPHLWPCVSCQIQSETQIVVDSYLCNNLYKSHLSNCTVFENHRKSLIQHCERSELRLHFKWTKVN